MRERSPGRHGRRTGRLKGPKTDEPPLEGGFAIEKNQERVVPGEGSDLVGQARLVDRLGDRAGRTRTGQKNDAQAAAPNLDRDVIEEPAQPGVISIAGGGALGRGVDVPVATLRLDEPEFG